MFYFKFLHQKKLKYEILKSFQQFCKMYEPESTGSIFDLINRLWFGLHSNESCID